MIPLLRSGINFLILVKPAPALSSKKTRHYHLSQQRRRSEPFFAVLLEHDLADVVGGIEAHEVEQGERSHRVAAAELHRLVDVLDRADARLVRADGVEEVRDEEAIDDEAGVVAARDRLFAE